MKESSPKTFWIYTFKPSESDVLMVLTSVCQVQLVASRKMFTDAGGSDPGDPEVTSVWFEQLGGVGRI